MADSSLSRSRVPAGFGFAAKLCLAIMTVVTLVSGVILLVTHRGVEMAYARQAALLGTTQFDFFKRLQTQRLQEVRRRMADYSSGAEGVRFRAALNALLDASDPREKNEEGVKEVYAVLEEGLKSIRGVETSAESDTNSLALFYRVLDSKGFVIEPPADVDAGLKNTLEVRKKLQESLASIRGALTNAARLETGYLVVHPSPDRTVLVELVSTRVTDTFNEITTFLGTLVVGFAVPVPEPDSGNASTAIWIAGELHPSALDGFRDPATVDAVGRLLSGGVKSGEGILSVRGTPHRVSFRKLGSPTGFPDAFQVSFFSLAESLAAQASLRGRVLTIAAAGLLAGFLVSLFLAHGLSVPIRRLVAATHDILAGKFDLRLPVASRDEVGELTASFNEMAEGLALKERYHNVLNQVADKQVAAELMSGKVALGGEVREVSVIFCDIRGFTALTEKMAPSEVIAVLNEHMTALTRVVHEHHGVVDKFVGDLIMAIFGAPRSYGDDARLAAECALRMISERRRLNEVSSYKIEVGVGLATGTVVAGCMGSEDRLNYTVLGERVNLASRLCSKAGPMDVVIDTTTRNAIGELAVVQSMEPLLLKGFALPVPTFKLLDIQKNQPKK